MIGPLDADDILEIQQLIARIAATADLAENLDDYLANFTDDVVFDFAPVPALDLAGHVYSGLDAVRAGALERRSAGVQGPGSRTMHVVSDLVVTPSGADAAEVHVAWQYFGLRDGLPAVLALGFYRNLVRRVDGRWLLARREVTVF